MRKYELTDQTIQHAGRTLYRIRAVRSFGDVSAGDLGGYIESERNLSHDGLAWVYDDARVFDGARVFGDACVFNTAILFSDARVFGVARLFGDARVC